jgi:hypothetical protein
MKKLVPYFIEMEPEWGYSLHLLKPTGKWKLVNGPYEDNMIYVQHKGLIFKRWIREDDIKFYPEQTEEIFNCRGTE